MRQVPSNIKVRTHISATYKGCGDSLKVADAAGELYCYGHDDVLFKSRKVAEFQFRPTAECVMPYFVGGKNVENGYDEDGGIAQCLASVRSNACRVFFKIQETLERFIFDATA